MKRPKLVRDWVNGYVKSLKPVSNGQGSMPKGTIFQITSAGIKAHFKSFPCNCCGFQFSFSSKSRHKFDDMEWLGYDFPGREKDVISLLKKGELIAAIKKYRECGGVPLREALDYCNHLTKIHRI